MIDRKQIIHRDYDGKDCVHFEINVKDEENTGPYKNIIVLFDRQKNKYEDRYDTWWKVTSLIDIRGELRCINFDIETFRMDMSLEKVAAIGLKDLKKMLIILSSDLMDFTFAIGDMIEGM